VGTLKEDLASQVAELVETHISWVFVGQAEVWKVKKPVDLGFLDFTTAEKRRIACDREVVLNRRLAPDVYLGVVPVTRDAKGTHRFGGEGEAVDWAVRMARLPQSIRADVMLERGQLTAEHVEATATAVARFHAGARHDEETSAFGRPEAIAVNVRENFEQTRESVRQHIREDEAREIERWQNRFLEEHVELFRARIEAGRVRDGHGDLRLEHVYFQDEGSSAASVTILDCIEFNERFRFADVCADIAFLSMDLEWHGRSDLAEWCLAVYARESGDYDMYRLVDFYESYRAYVRGKIAGMLATDGAASTPAREHAASQARRYYLLALASERQPLVGPSVIAVGGVIASGKSTVAQRLGRSLGIPVVDTDRTRKWMVGARPTDNISTGTWSGAYDPSFTEEVYQEVLRRAEVVLDSGRAVVLDASFRSPAMRAAARKLAADRGLDFHFLECHATAEVCKARLRERARGASVSDGRLEIFDSFASSWEPAEELGAGERIVLDTTRPIEVNLHRLQQQLPSWPEGLKG
jgi:hypothetical protein